MRPPFPSDFSLSGPVPRASRPTFHPAPAPLRFTCHRPGVVNPPTGPMAVATRRCAHLVLQRLRGFLTHAA